MAKLLRNTQSLREDLAILQSGHVKCEFCGKIILKEKVDKHQCVRKQRWQLRHTPESMMAFEMFIDFMRHTNSVGFHKKIEFMDFIKNSSYKLMIRAAMRVYASDVFMPERFRKWLIRSGLPAQDWAETESLWLFSRQLYEEEPRIEGVQRTTRYINQWCNDNQVSLGQFAKKVSSNQLTRMICGGVFSPWVLLNPKHVDIYFEKLTTEQSDVIFSIIDVDLWSKQLEKDIQT